jgi:2-amino-4-hydroxy-6-hydroxymethyldihydropteridine diphosphokinase
MTPEPNDDWTVIGIGGNVGTAAVLAARFADARSEIEAIAEVEGRMSSLYRTAPLGAFAGQPAFVNAILALPWQPTDPEALLAALQIIEALHGRSREVDGSSGGGPRTLDLDLLLVGRTTIVSAELFVPHPRMHERRFVLEPMAEVLGGDFALPDGRLIAEVLASAEIARQVVEKLPDEP